jgi:hypothetical protein
MKIVIQIKKRIFTYDKQNNIDGRNEYYYVS